MFRKFFRPVRVLQFSIRQRDPRHEPANGLFRDLEKLRREVEAFVAYGGMSGATLQTGRAVRACARKAITKDRR